MGEKQDGYRRINRFDPSTQIIIIWGAEDVQRVRPDLQDSQALEVLYSLKDKYNSNVGISWDIIAHRAEELFPNSQKG